MQPHTHRALAYASLALCMTLVGAYVALSKPLVAAMPVFLLAWLRFGIGALAMPHWLQPGPQEPPLTAQAKRLLFLESLLGNFLFSICMLYGVSMTSAVSAGVILAALPAVAALMGWLFLGERISARTWVAIACAAFGIGLLSLSKQQHTEATQRAMQAGIGLTREVIGNLLLIGAVLCEAAYIVIGKKLTASIAPKRIAAIINLWGWVLMTPPGLYLALQFDFAGVPATLWLLLVFYALAASVWTVWLWMTGLQTVPAANAAVFTVLLPISAAAVGVLLLGETLRGLQWLAFGIALLGVLLATLPARSALRPAAVR